MTTKTRIEEAVAGAHSLVGQLKVVPWTPMLCPVKAMYNEMRSR